MSLPTNRQDGDVIENEDINALASAINDHEDRLTSVESGSGASGSSNLLVVSGSVALDNGLAVGSLVGYRATGSTTFTGQGGSVALAAGAYVFERVSGGWTYRTIDEGNGLTPPAPDNTPPTAGTLAVTGVTNNAATLTVTGASDNQALAAAPYAFSTNNGSTWSGWQTSNVYSASGLTAETAYQGRHKVRDASGNEASGTAQSFTTAAAPVVWSTFATDDFNRANTAEGVLGTTSDGLHTWVVPGNHKILNNKMYGTGATTPAAYLNDVTPDADQEVHVKVALGNATTPGGTCWASVSLRYDPTATGSTCYRISLKSDPSAAFIQAIGFDNGTGYVIDGGTAHVGGPVRLLGNNEEVALVLRAVSEGGSVRVSVEADGVEIFSVLDNRSTKPAGRSVGFVDQNAVTYDDLVVRGTA